MSEGTTISPLAGRPAPKDLLIDPAKVERAYYEQRPDMADPNQRVSFGTSGWFAARPSGTENIYKIYAESFKDEAHLDAIIHEAKDIVSNVLRQHPVPA